MFSFLMSFLSYDEVGQLLCFRLSTLFSSHVGAFLTTDIPSVAQMKNGIGVQRP